MLGNRTDQRYASASNLGSAPEVIFPGATSEEGGKDGEGEDLEGESSGSEGEDSEGEDSEGGDSEGEDSEGEDSEGGEDFLDELDDRELMMYDEMYDSTQTI